MSRAHLIYPLRGSLERQLSRIEKDAFNSAIITRYYKVRSSKLSLASQVWELKLLAAMSRLLGKGFEDATVSDIEDLVFKINQRHPNPNTQNKYRKVLKGFYRWLRGCAKREYPPEVKWIELNRVPLVTVGPEDLPSFEEALRVTEHAFSLRDKALFQCKLDAGCRIGEILTPTVGEVHFNEYGATVDSEGKTGNQPLILTWSAKTLTQWLNIHPFRNDPSAPLWPLLGREKPVQLSYAAARKALADCVRRAGYPKRLWPHLFKHVSCTKDFNDGMPAQFREVKHHWTKGSRMHEVYEHLSQETILKVQAETWRNLTVSHPKVQPPGTARLELLKKCKRCDYENPRDSLFCNRCAFALSDRLAAENGVKAAVGLSQPDETQSKVEELSAELARSPEILDTLLNALKLVRNMGKESQTDG